MVCNHAPILFIPYLAANWRSLLAAEKNYPYMDSIPKYGNPLPHTVSSKENEHSLRWFPFRMGNR